LASYAGLNKPDPETIDPAAESGYLAAALTEVFSF
jgi:hypothetical protein